MSYIKAALAIFKGIQLCFSERKITKLAIWPWMVGAVCYFSTLVGVFRLHPLLLQWWVVEPEGFWKSILFGLAWLGMGIGLLISAMLVSITLVMVFTSVFQTSIAAQVLSNLGRLKPLEPSGLKGLLKETARTMTAETFKLLWLVPLFVILIIVGFIPLLTPIALLLGAWLLAYSFVDIILDIYLLKAGARLRFAGKHAPLLICYGLVLTVLWAIPFVGLLLPPAAVAGAAWLLNETALLNDLEQGLDNRRSDTKNNNGE